MPETTQEDRELWKATAEWWLLPTPRPKPPPLCDDVLEAVILTLIRDVDTLVEALRVIGVSAGCILEFCDRLEAERTGYTSIRAFRETAAALRNAAKEQQARCAVLAPKP